jgi:hypothetical protein
MPTATPLYCAVLTGDIVRSGRLSPQKFKTVQEILQRGSQELSLRFPNRMPLPIEVFRGDSWQLLVTDPGAALRIGLYFRGFLRAEAGADTRLSIGVGAVDSMPLRSVGESRGDAFRISGELLDKRSPSRMRFGISSQHPVDWWEERSIAVLLAVLDVFVTRWTSAQARAVCGALLDWTQEQIAERWVGEAITQQAAGQHLARAGWDGVHEAVGYYEEVMKKWRPQ